MNRLSKTLALVSVGIVFTFAYAYSNIVHALLIEYSSFEETELGLYVSSRLDQHAQEEFSALMEQARTRVAQTYGVVSATPVIIVVRGMDEAHKYGLGKSPGTLFSTPWQQYLIVNFDHLEGVDVVAHELVHAELVERLGYFTKMQQIPTWFDEGAAMQVDYRQHYSVRGIDKRAIDAVKKLESASKFWTDDQAQNVINYRASKKAVADIFRFKDPNGLYKMLSKIESGAAFVEVVESAK